MGYSEWINVTVEATNYPIQIENAMLEWGKFYWPDDMDIELSPDQIDSIQIAPGATNVICSCGREDASSGTQGSFDIYDSTNPAAAIYVGTFSWNCPYGNTNNQWKWEPAEDPSPYLTQTSGGSLTRAIGNMTLTSTKQGASSSVIAQPANPTSA